MMKWRPFQTNDLAECLAMDATSLGHELLGRDRALQAWQTLTKTPAFIGALLYEERRIGGSHIVGFGCTAFVSEDFALRELADPRPGLNARVLASLSTEQPATLTREQIARGNSSDGLYAVILTSFLRESDLSVEQMNEAASVMSAAALHCHSGFRLRMFLREACGAGNIRHVLWQKVFRMVSDYHEFLQQNPANHWGRERMLFTLDAAGARSVAGSLYQSLFHYRPPVLYLTEVEQDLLSAALGGLTDDELARVLGLKLGTVKKRWASILQRVSTNRPDLLPETNHGGDTRGRQRRHHLLAYLRDHPEELRPWAAEKPGRTRVTTMPLRIRV